ncbi:hypothetical protein SLEP1_g28352 [Rubroshorea leprosula]|uniref:RING-type domain-containing protein n=1 Tax=Rubroshorea leprosula TaxID=152421 RepID=A0AAV5K350_9ROSI|nr:hypothetical protein SLEP1_g28352 [Rubroshorea leprosula]
MTNDYVKVQKGPLVDCLTCSLCKNVYKDATTICSCLHTFCKQCILQKLGEDKESCCPMCKAYLGSFPEELLRPDHSLREVVAQIFPSENSTREERSTSSLVNVTNPTIARPSAAKALLEDFGSLRETKRSHDDKDVAEQNNCHLNAKEKQETEMLQIASVVSKPMADICSLKRTNNDSSWEQQVHCEEGETYKTKSNIIPCNLETKCNIEMKKKKRTKRKPCKFISGQRCYDVKTGNSKEFHPDSSAVGRSIDSGKQFGEAISLKELSVSHPFWFCLLACQERKGISLPQIPKPYIRTKIGGLAVSILTKYLAKKLNLKHETEVEIMCFGHPLPPTLMLNDLIDIWMEAVSDMGQAFINHGEGTATGENIVMELTYRRSKKPLL